MFWEGGVDHGSVAHSWEKRGRVDSRSVTLYKRRVYSGRGGGVFSGRVAYRSKIFKRRGGGIFWEGGVQ